MRKVGRSIIIFFIALVTAEVFFGAVFFIKDMKRPPTYLKRALDYPYLYFSFKADPGNLVNEDGLYTDKSKKPDPAKYRIILMGGSVARSSKAKPDETIAYHIEKALGEKFGDIVEVVNAGMAAYVAEQEFIFTQLVLQKYQPDMIIGLDGYNDLISYESNRHTPFRIAPENWRDFMVIQDGREKKKLSYRFKVFFGNIFRALNFIARSAQNKSDYDYSGMTNDELEEVSRAYAGILDDTRDFCASKGIKYYSFLQPVRWYLASGTEHTRLGGIKELGRLYNNFDKKVKNLPYGFSLTDIFDARPDVYEDNCHVNAEGNVIFAKAIASSIEKRLLEDAEFLRFLKRKSFKSA